MRCTHSALGGRVGLGRIYYHTLLLSVLEGRVSTMANQLLSSFLKAVLSHHDVLTVMLWMTDKRVFTRDTKSLRHGW